MAEKHNFNDYNYDLTELLKYIDPATLSYQEWVNVGMALKESGYAASDWDEWSRADKRYHQNECFRKWETFRGSAMPVTAGTIVQMAKENGWVPAHTGTGAGHELDWEDAIGGGSDTRVVDSGWIEDREVREPGKWDPVQDIINYIEALFEPNEKVGYVTETYKRDESYLPKKGHWDRTASELIQELNKCSGDICAVFGDYKQEAGAWIRFNPLDGKGCRDSNVTDYRYALVESDTVGIDRQNAILRELELPIATLVHSGKKSLHAIVKINASDYADYKKRVEYLYKVCEKNGLKVDVQNKNPSRLSRMPGIIRNGRKQFLVDRNIGKGNWDEWVEWIEGFNDDLPDTECLAAEWDSLPELSPPLINGILRQGHKMLISGPSKAGKSFALIEMCIALAEGRKWINWQCTKGKVLYVNLELDRVSCLHRFKDVYEKLGWEPSGLSNIDIWNLRGKSAPMDKLAPKLIRRALKKNYTAIIIDPIYKIITGDENSADQMAHFCNQFDRICTELGCAVIYCHHHSKNSQYAKKSMDRASGSGVFARDPDALIDLSEIELTEDAVANRVNNALCEVYAQYMNDNGCEEFYSQDDMCSQSKMAELARRHLPQHVYREMQKELYEAEGKTRSQTAWRIEGTLREFPKFTPVDLWFNYPIHEIDRTGVLADVMTGPVKGERKTWKKNFQNKKTENDRKKEREEGLLTAYNACKINGQVYVSDLVEFTGKTERTIISHIKESDLFWLDKKKVGLKKE